MLAQYMPCPCVCLTSILTLTSTRTRILTRTPIRTLSQTPIQTHVDQIRDPKFRTAIRSTIYTITVDRYLAFSADFLQSASKRKPAIKRPLIIIIIIITITITSVWQPERDCLHDLRSRTYSAKPMPPRHGTGSHFVTQRPSDPVTLFYNERKYRAITSLTSRRSRPYSQAKEFLIIIGKSKSSLHAVD